MFQLLQPTNVRLTKLVTRVQKAGDDDVPAISYYLKLESVENSILDMLSPTIRFTAYAPIEGQETLPGVPQTMPILRSKDLKHWAPEELRYDGWSIAIAYGVGSEIRSGSCKIDTFACDFHEGGYCDVEFKVSTADIDSDGVGILWAQQKRVLSVTITAPELPAVVIDGSVKAFEADYTEAGPTDLFMAGADDLDEPQEPGQFDEGYEPDDSEGGAPDAGPAEPQRGENWPFGTRGNAEPGFGETVSQVADTASQDGNGDAEQREIEAGMAAAITKAGVKPGRKRAGARA